MNSPTRFNSAVLLCIACIFFLAGCARNQYEKVAKEWCTAIRASQMIPVYPLNQDIRPGDVYLVQSAIGQQAKEYKDKGFLSLDDLRTRLELKPETYSNKMYFDSYFKSEGTLPFAYPTLTPPTSEILQPGKTSISTTLTATPAPRVAFPSYSFTIKSGQGLSLGVPISAIPVALNFLGAQETSGTVTLANASTYQADHETIMEQLEKWVKKPRIKQELLAACQYVGKEYVFLRVIKRVYLVGAVDVALERKDKYQGGLQAGLAEQSTDTEVSVANFEKNIEKQTKLLELLNKLAAQNKMGGAVNFNIATQRNIGLRESFDRPLVVGYLGMDVPFFEDGRLGGPIPTFERLELKAQLGDPKPIQLADLLEATNYFKSTASSTRTRLQAITAAEQFCRKAGGKFASLGDKAKAIKTSLSKPETVSDETVDNFARELITEINFQSTIGPDKEEKRVYYAEELRSALRDQGL
jgi:hypothetical protein